MSNQIKINQAKNIQREPIAFLNIFETKRKIISKHIEEIDQKINCIGNVLEKNYEIIKALERKIETIIENRSFLAEIEIEWIVEKVSLPKEVIIWKEKKKKKLIEELMKAKAAKKEIEEEISQLSSYINLCIQERSNLQKSLDKLFEENTIPFQSLHLN